MDYITVIKAARPVNKRFVLQPDGTVEKSGVATLYSGVAQSRHVPDAEAMARVLEEVTESTHLVIVAGRWRGDDGTPFEIVTKDELTKRLGVSEADLPDGIVEVGGVRCAARLQRMVEPSSWILLDADSPKGITPAGAGTRSVWTRRISSGDAQARPRTPSGWMKPCSASMVVPTGTRTGFWFSSTARMNMAEYTTTLA